MGTKFSYTAIVGMVFKLEMIRKKCVVGEYQSTSAFNLRFIRNSSISCLEFLLVIFLKTNPNPQPALGQCRVVWP